MARHHSYSKRSRESRKAMGDGDGDQPNEPDDGAADDWQAAVDVPGRLSESGELSPG